MNIILITWGFWWFVTLLISSIINLIYKPNGISKRNAIILSLLFFVITLIALSYFKSFRFGYRGNPVDASSLFWAILFYRHLLKEIKSDNLNKKKKTILERYNYFLGIKQEGCKRIFILCFFIITLLSVGIFSIPYLIIVPLSIKIYNLIKIKLFIDVHKPANDSRFSKLIASFYLWYNKVLGINSKKSIFLFILFLILITIFSLGFLFIPYLIIIPLALKIYRWVELGFNIDKKVE